MRLLDAFIQGVQVGRPPRPDVAITDLDLIVVIVHQKCLEDVLLIVGLVSLEDPTLRIVVREENIVQMDECAGGELRKHAKEQPVNVATGLRAMGTVIEQNIAGLELRED
jgi:hypothetical protein